MTNTSDKIEEIIKKIIFFPVNEKYFGQNCRVNQNNIFFRKRVFYEIIIKIQNILFFHCKNGYANAQQRHFIRKLLVLL
jgi:hypothetical protein